MAAGQSSTGGNPSGETTQVKATEKAISKGGASVERLARGTGTR